MSLSHDRAYVLTPPEGPQILALRPRYLDTPDFKGWEMDTAGLDLGRRIPSEVFLAGGPDAGMIISQKGGTWRIEPLTIETWKAFAKKQTIAGFEYLETVLTDDNALQNYYLTTF